MNSEQAFAQHLDGPGSAKKTPSPAAECIQHQVILNRIQQDNGPRARMGGSQSSQKGKTTLRTIFEVHGNQHNIHMLAAEHLQSLFHAHCGAYDPEPTLACQRTTQQLAGHKVLVRDENRYQAWRL
jgi:hypothetical protein